MKHFMIEITYLLPMDQIQEILPLHREFLQTGYDKKILLCSGPQEPRVGGIVVARAESMDELKEYFANDPYMLNKAADYRFVEFNPVKFQEFIEPWLNGQNI